MVKNVMKPKISEAVVRPAIKSRSETRTKQKDAVSATGGVMAPGAKVISPRGQGTRKP